MLCQIIENKVFMWRQPYGAIGQGFLHPLQFVQNAFREILQPVAQIIAARLIVKIALLPNHLKIARHVAVIVGFEGKNRQNIQPRHAENSAGHQSRRAAIAIHKGMNNHRLLVKKTRQ